MEYFVYKLAKGLLLNWMLIIKSINVILDKIIVNLFIIILSWIKYNITTFLSENAKGHFHTRLTPVFIEKITAITYQKLGDWADVPKLSFSW